MDAGSSRKAPARRSFLGIVAGSFVAVGGAAAVWPLVSSLSPNPSSPRDVLEVDLTGIGEGEWRTVRWRAQPIVVRHRTAQEIAAARDVSISDLRDGLARVAGQPPALAASDENRTKPGQPTWLVVTAVCPRSGCVVEPRRPGDGFEPGIAWFCPCDACRFDTSGRIRSGLSPENLAVPLYRFISPTRIEIGVG